MLVTIVTDNYVVSHKHTNAKKKAHYIAAAEQSAPPGRLCIKQANASKLLEEG